MERPHIAWLVAALMLAGCAGMPSGQDSDQTTTGGTGGTGSASAYLKDKPSDDFREVHVVVTEAKVHRSGGDDDGNGTANATATGTSTAVGTSTSVGNTTVSGGANVTATVPPNSTTTSGSPGAGWVTLYSDPQGVDIDLLNTTGARAAFLGEEDLAAGHYQQLRMTIASAYGITQDGENVTIEVSSGTLKSVRGFDVQAGKETRITVDLDLEKSLHEQGSGHWRMTPVIGRTTAQAVDDGSSGEDSAEPGDVEDVPEAGPGGTTVSGSVSTSTSTSVSITNSTSGSSTTAGP